MAGTKSTVKKAALKVVFTYGGDNPLNRTMPAWITLEQRQTQSAKFRLTYGLQVEDGLTYAQAAKALGIAILHYLSCESIVNNEGA